MSERYTTKRMDEKKKTTKEQPKENEEEKLEKLEKQFEQAGGIVWWPLIQRSPKKGTVIEKGGSSRGIDKDRRTPVSTPTASGNEVADQSGNELTQSEILNQKKRSRMEERRNRINTDSDKDEIEEEIGLVIGFLDKIETTTSRQSNGKLTFNRQDQLKVREALLTLNKE